MQAELERDALPGSRAKYGFPVQLRGRSADQRRDPGRHEVRARVGLRPVHLVLVWSFSSWSWPLVVMSAIPLGLAGAIFITTGCSASTSPSCRCSASSASPRHRGGTTRSSLVSLFKGSSTGAPWGGPGRRLLRPPSRGAADLAPTTVSGLTHFIFRRSLQAVPDPDGGLDRLRAGASRCCWCCSSSPPYSRCWRPAPGRQAHRRERGGLEREAQTATRTRRSERLRCSTPPM